MKHTHAPERTNLEEMTFHHNLSAETTTPFPSFPTLPIILFLICAAHQACRKIIYGTDFLIIVSPHRELDMTLICVIVSAQSGLSSAQPGTPLSLWPRRIVPANCCFSWLWWARFLTRRSTDEGSPSWKKLRWGLCGLRLFEVPISLMLPSMRINQLIVIKCMNRFRTRTCIIFHRDLSETFRRREAVRRWPQSPCWSRKETRH